MPAMSRFAKIPNARKPAIEDSGVKETGLQISLYSVVTLALCAVVSTAGVAREQSHAGSATASARQHAVPQRKSNNEADMPISIEHSDVIGSGGHAGSGPKGFRIVPSAHRNVHVAEPSVATGVAGRNAIGLPIVRREAVPRDSAAPADRSQTRPPMPPAVATGILAVGSPTTMRHTAPPAGRPISAVSRGTIGAVSLMPRRATGLGGPSAPIGGINGTAFLPKY